MGLHRLIQWVQRLSGSSQVSFEEAETFEELPDTLFHQLDLFPVIQEDLAPAFVRQKDPAEKYYWWEEISVHWLEKIGRQLPGKSRVITTPAFLILSHQKDRPLRWMVNKLERIRMDLLQLYEGVAQDPGPGKNVVIVLPNQQEYYRYISIYYPEGEFALSGGIQIRQGAYPHIAVFDMENFGVELGAFAHELTHLYLGHLDLPTWVDEACAQTYEFSVSGKLFDDRELLIKHEATWNRRTIQEFWAGRSFHSPELQEVSYHLAYSLMFKIERVLTPAKKSLLQFIQHARRHDAGQASAEEFLGIDLGDLVASFLGPGDWSPRSW